jgi:hypothetical protein
MLAVARAATADSLRSDGMARSGEEALSVNCFATEIQKTQMGIFDISG